MRMPVRQAQSTANRSTIPVLRRGARVGPTVMIEKPVSGVATCYQIPGAVTATGSYNWVSEEMIMKSIKAVLVLSAAILGGCVAVPVRPGYYGGGAARPRPPPFFSAPALFQDPPGD